MGRPASEIMGGGGDWYWARVDSVADHIGANSERMASILGMTGGQYRGWRSKGEMPAAAWARFLAYERTVTEATTAKQEGWGQVWDRGTGAFVPRPLPYPVKECANVRSRAAVHFDTFIPRVKRQRFCCPECRREWANRERAERRKIERSKSEG